MKSPQTGKRVPRVNPAEKREIVTVPEWRIVSDELWARVKARQREVRIEMARDTDGNLLNRAHRRRYLLSGLLVCGCCGGPYIILGRDRYGCATARTKSACANTRTITRPVLEGRVLGGLKERLLTPALTATFVEEYRRAVEVAARAGERAAAERERALARTRREIAHVVAAIKRGKKLPSLVEELDALEQQKAMLEAAAPAAPPPPVAVAVVQLSPAALARVYAERVARLEAALNEEADRGEAAEILRRLIDRIELHPCPGGGRGLVVRLYGALASIVTLGSGNGPAGNPIGAQSRLPVGGAKGRPSQLSEVAGARNQRYLHLLRARVPVIGRPRAAPIRGQTP